MLIKLSENGLDDWNYAQANNIVIGGYNAKCQGQGRNPILVNPCGSPVYDAGTIAHEITHDRVHADGTLYEEYQAFMEDDIVRNDLITLGYGSKSDLKHDLSVYTVNLENTDLYQLSEDLKNWFNQYEPLYQTPTTSTVNGIKGYGILPALPSPWITDTYSGY